MKKMWNYIVREEYPFFFAAPALLWQILFLCFPLVVIAGFSFLDFSQDVWWKAFTFDHYVRVLRPVYLKVILNSFFLAIATTFITFIIAYPVAYFLAFKVKNGRTLLLFGIILPSWTNIIVQVYSWFFLLAKNGLVGRAVYNLGIVSQPTSLLNSFFSTMVGMVYCFLPFMVLPIYAVLERVDTRLFEASADLGAPWFETFKRVIFPLSLPGVYVGLMLVGIPAFGEFAIPTLMGGSKNAYWGSVIVQKFLILRDWASGFALAMLGIAFLCLFVITVHCLIYVCKKVSRTVLKLRVLVMQPRG
jgi:spermidine/putrescine transport system permease protein